MVKKSKAAGTEERLALLEGMEIGKRLELIEMWILATEVTGKKDIQNRIREIHKPLILKEEKDG